MKIFQNDLIFIETHESEIPWLKIFTTELYKEFSHCPKNVKVEIWRVLDIIEKEMLSYYNPKKINIASFGNYLPLVHFHIMARFEEDAYFPDPMWGKKQRKSTLELKSLDGFLENLKPLL